jgi:hypothetical protein
MEVEQDSARHQPRVNLLLDVYDALGRQSSYAAAEDDNIE